ncbi:MAG TPA: hypothetical protein VNY33_08135, partial [Gaiellaceae bacterium]|nr:hypothetical protein [Gaiellaceae bacterium]
MRGRRVQQLLETTPVDPAAEERAWALAQAAYGRREPVPRPRRHTRAVLVLAAAGAAIAAA